MDITELLRGQLSGPVLEQLTRQIGARDTQQTRAAADGIMNVLLGAMAQNAAKPGGASALANALERDHDGSVLNHVLDMVNGQLQPSNPKAINGAGILGHILGKRQSGAVEAVTKSSGLNASQVSNLMVMLAPVIMGALGKTKRDNQLDEGGLAGMLSGVLGGMTEGKSRQQDPKMAIINAFLDKNKDGQIADDLVRMGGGFLSRIFGRKK